MATVPMRIDVENLFRRTPLSAEIYQTFRASAERVPKLEFRAAGAMQQPSEIVMERIAGEAGVTEKAKREAQQQPQMHRPLAESQYELLHSVFVKDNRHTTSGDHTNGANPFQTYCTVRVSGATGGAGVSTLLGILARAFSKKGQRAILLDTGAHGSILPYYFAKSTKVSLRGIQIASPVTGGQPVIFLEPHADAPEGWIDTSLAAFSAYPHRLLVDGESASGGGVHRPTVHLIVLNPDLQSMRRVEAIYKSLSGQPVLFVLNKFDANASLHKHVLQLLSPRIGTGKLLTVRRSDEFSEGLAEGCTILDFAPHSAAAEDVTTVVAAIERLENGILAKGVVA